MKRVLILSIVPTFVLGQPPSARTIMDQVIENQDKARAARLTYVYDQNVFVRLQHPNGKPAREESRQYTVLPQEEKVERTLLKVDGKIFQGRKQIPYTDPEFRSRKVDLDGELAESFAGTILWKSKADMPLDDWFPLTSQRARDYQFEWKGEERYRDFDVYRISFSGQECWSGEVLVEKNELEPVLVTTAFDCKIPKPISVILGTNFSQAGAKMTFQRLEPGVWFPATVGGELKLRLLFFYARTIAFTATSSGFRKTDVKSSVAFDEP